MGIQIKKFIKLKKEMLETEDIEIFKMLYPAYADESDKVIKREIKLMKERQAAVNTREKRDDSPGWDKSWAETTRRKKNEIY